MKITIGEYLLNRLHELGINHIFGVPGDYNLAFLDQVMAHHNLAWIGTCNELNGAYASDGYARINGAAALITTYGVGELSAINGIAGAYAEYVPVVHIVGMPTHAVQNKKALVHHTLGDGNFNIFSDMYSKLTAASALLTSANAAKEIDRVLEICWLMKRPVYIGLPAGLSYEKIDKPVPPLNLNYPKSDPDAVNEVVERIAALIEQSKNPVILVDICAIRHPMKSLIEEFLDKTGIPFANMNMGKGIIRESHPNFLGNYNGDLSSPTVQERVEHSTCALTFGMLMSDFNTGGFTTNLQTNATIEIHSSHVKLQHSMYPALYFQDVISALLKRLKKFNYHEVVIKNVLPAYQAEQILITQERFWQRMSNYLEKNTIVIAEAGTSLFGMLAMPIPDGASFIGQPLWGSIGYTVGATLGAALAAPERQCVLFVGDGSFQLTAQEVSTMIRHKLKPVIFLINNDGYTVERIIHGPTARYNDIQMWNYAEFPKIFGDNVWTTTISSEQELEQALQEIKNHREKLIFIEVIMDKNDVPIILKEIGMACAQQNQS